MVKQQSVASVVEEMTQSILASPKRQRHLMSKTFWSKFGFKVRSRERIEDVAEAFRQRGVLIYPHRDTFGAEDKEDWIVLSYLEPPQQGAPIAPMPLAPQVPTPPDDWFNKITTRTFGSEREVEYFFIIPLLLQLGYSEHDLAVGVAVNMYEGTNHITKTADCVVYEGLDRSGGNALLLIEAKSVGQKLTDAAIGQARSYVLWLHTPYYLITNGDETRLYLFREARLPDVKLAVIARHELREQWPFLYQLLNRAAVVKFKKALVANV